MDKTLTSLDILTADEMLTEYYVNDNQIINVSVQGVTYQLITISIENQNAKDAFIELLPFKWPKNVTLKESDYIKIHLPLNSEDLLHVYTEIQNAYHKEVTFDLNEENI